MSGSPSGPSADELREQFRQTLVENTLSNVQTVSNYIHTGDVSKYTSPRGLTGILSLNTTALSDVAQRVLDFTENSLASGSDADLDYARFKWRLTAFVHVQDVFDAACFGDIASHDWLSAFSQWYFYYESKHVLTESILCGLNGLGAASNTLLRVFLEFSIRQCYFWRTIQKCGSYEPLRNYLSTGRAPSWGTQIAKCLPNVALARPVRARLQWHLNGLSESSAHPYPPDLSPRQDANAERKPTLLDVFFWYGTDTILEPVLWLYYLNFPMLFQPVNWVRRYGFNGPLGWYIDEVGGHVVKQSLSAQSYGIFRKYSEENSDVRALIDGLRARRELTDEQMQSTWNEKTYGPYPGFDRAFGLMMARMRATREGMALRTYRAPDGDGVELLRGKFDFAVWKDFYREVEGRRGRQDEA